MPWIAKPPALRPFYLVSAELDPASNECSRSAPVNTLSAVHVGVQ